ncbi:hypothetical protein NQL31_004607 [Lotmaria passim]
MPANFALAKDCQLFRKDVEGVLTLAAQLMLSSSSSSTAINNNNSKSAGTSEASSSRSLAGPLIGAVLTEASIRSQLLNTLVRVLVPAHRHSALLHGNKYVKLANEAAKKSLEQQQQNPSQANHKQSSGSHDADTAASSLAADQQQQQQYRVGRVVGVVPKPGAKASSAAAGTSATSSPVAADQVQRWLLAVYVGECVEPFTVAALSDEPFTETEHRIFVQSALSTNREEGGRRASVLPSQQPVLLSAEAAATVQQNIKDMRRVLGVVDALCNVKNSEEEAAAAAAVKACRAETLQRASGVKRPRDEGSDGSSADASHHQSTTAAAAEEESGEASPLTPFLGNGASSQAARLARLANDVAARTQQLEQLRQLLLQKDQEVKSTLQQLQQREAQHRGEIDVWRAKAEEQSRAQARAAKESADSLEQRDRLLEKANTELRRLAVLTTKYKKVADTVAGLLRRGGDDSNSANSGGGGEGARKPMSPDEILAALQHKTLV